MFLRRRRAESKRGNFRAEPRRRRRVVLPRDHLLHVHARGFGRGRTLGLVVLAGAGAGSRGGFLFSLRRAAFRVLDGASARRLRRAKIRLRGARARLRRFHRLATLRRRSFRLGFVFGFIFL